jgi:hypothetical protein
LFDQAQEVVFPIYQALLDYCSGLFYRDPMTEKTPQPPGEMSIPFYLARNVETFNNPFVKHIR